MRWTALLLIATAALTLAPRFATEPAAQQAFRGTWTSTDVDGSNQILWIRGSRQTGHYAVRLFDDAATAACAGAPARAQGSGIIEGETLTWTATVTCPGTGRGPATGRIGPLALTYDEATDTLVDDSGVVWHRLH